MIGFEAVRSQQIRVLQEKSGHAQHEQCSDRRSINGNTLQMAGSLIWMQMECPLLSREKRCKLKTRHEEMVLERSERGSDWNGSKPLREVSRCPSDWMAPQMHRLNFAKPCSIDDRDAWTTLARA